MSHLSLSPGGHIVGIYKCFLNVVCPGLSFCPKKKAALKILCSICFPIVMLSNPVLENPVNLKAAHILMKDETLYMPCS